MNNLEERIKSLNLSEKETRDLLWWGTNGLREAYEYLENWKWTTDVTEKFSEDHICCICGEYSPQRTKGKFYCDKHSRHVRLYGHALAITSHTPNEIRVKDGFIEVVTRSRDTKSITGVFLVDDDDILSALQYKWSSHNSYCSGGRTPSVRLHNLILPPPNKNMFVDHISKNPSDNRKNNLRLVTNQENTFNGGLSKNNSVGVIGVNYRADRKVYSASLGLNRAKHHLGDFKTLYEATVARLNAEVKYYGKFAPQQHLYREYDIDDSSVEYDLPRLRECGMYLKKALELYTILIEENN